MTTEERDDGFTLVELLIVIVILGILAAVVVFAVSGIADSSQEAGCQTEHRQLATAVEAYFALYRADSIPDGGDGAAATLRDAGIIRKTSEYYDVTTTGDIVQVFPCN